METWHDLANVYTSLSQWRDAELLFLKLLLLYGIDESNGFNLFSKHVKSSSSQKYWEDKIAWNYLSLISSSCISLLNEAKGFHQEALRSYRKALDVEPTHVPSLISTACILRQLGGQSMPIVRSFLTDALRLDRTNPAAGYNLGLLYKADASASALEAAECFEAAALLEESAPIEPFR
ncbi:No pollen germination related 2, putative [Theobroma cacao]|uniref:No pollen germination related 2, putative n=1 Tax=Theobroma cacao TaxID=3641 RepID=A0A061FR36_THECC|nr:No pollen germination related 2, putative [Theobroma cacao]